MNDLNSITDVQLELLSKDHHHKLEMALRDIYTIFKNNGQYIDNIKGYVILQANYKKYPFQFNHLKYAVRTGFIRIIKSSGQPYLYASDALGLKLEELQANEMLDSNRLDRDLYEEEVRFLQVYDLVKSYDLYNNDLKAYLYPKSDIKDLNLSKSEVNYLLGSKLIYSRKLALDNSKKQVYYIFEDSFIDDLTELYNDNYNSEMSDLDDSNELANTNDDIEKESSKLFGKSKWIHHPLYKIFTGSLLFVLGLIILLTLIVFVSNSFFLNVLVLIWTFLSLGYFFYGIYAFKIAKDNNLLDSSQYKNTGLTFYILGMVFLAFVFYTGGTLELRSDRLRGGVEEMQSVNLNEKLLIKDFSFDFDTFSYAEISENDIESSLSISVTNVSDSDHIVDFGIQAYDKDHNPLGDTNYIKNVIINAGDTVFIEAYKDIDVSLADKLLENGVYYKIDSVKESDKE